MVQAAGQAYRELQGHACGGHRHPPPCSLPPQSQLLLHGQSVHPFMVHGEALALQQDLGEPPIAKPSPGRRQLAQSLPQTWIFDPCAADTGMSPDVPSLARRRHRSETTASERITPTACLCICASLPLFCDHRLQCSFVQQQFGYGDTASSCRFSSLQLPQSPRLAHFHPAALPPSTDTGSRV